MIIPYISIARPDHWFKNVIMLLETVLVFFYKPELIGQLNQPTIWLTIAWAFAATCIVASSNYVINEILDAPTDLAHPKKRFRPIPSGQVKLPIAYIEWIALGALGLWMAWQIKVNDDGQSYVWFFASEADKASIAAGMKTNVWFFASAAWLLVMGLIYNIPPVRSKELPYLDVLSESVNNPIRLLLGWFALTGNIIPPISLMIAYWMAGAFFMAAKRWAEYKSINDPEAAAAYRRSFKWYNLDRLMVSMFFYAITCALFLGVFIVRYHLELILSMPFIAGFFAMYLHVTFLPDSPVQAPEHLYKQKGLMIYLIICAVVFFGLMFTNIPTMYELFNVEQTTISPLWTIGK